MDVERIRELIELMKENDLSEIRIVDGETRLLLRRGLQAGSMPMMQFAPMVQNPLGQLPASSAASASGSPPAGHEVSEDAHLLSISSPMVGTFYAAAAPDAEAYVRVGDRIRADTVVCIVEAMKVMNEIKAEVSGVIEKILVENGQPVEFGQPMFMIRPD
jgi:acetyl-CoA carboxylase biotin carboxyl carrier protein